MKIHINTRAHLRQEWWPDGTLTPKQAEEAEPQTVGDQEAFKYESNRNGKGT
jgi:hypothetical protein